MPIDPRAPEAAPGHLAGPWPGSPRSRPSRATPSSRRGHANGMSAWWVLRDGSPARRYKLVAGGLVALDRGFQICVLLAVRRTLGGQRGETGLRLVEFAL